MGSECSATGHTVIPLFDSLTHVTVDGRWFDTSYDASVSRLSAEIQLAAPCMACVVAIPGYNMPNSFVLDVCARDPVRLIPIAGLDPNLFGSRNEAEAELRRLREYGFRAVKIHPTLCNVHLDSLAFHWAMEACERTTMPVFLCTIMRRRGYVPSFSPIDLVYRTFVRHSGVRVLFLHSGLSDLLAYADLVRALPNALMDLSLTLMKYKGSSLDLDFTYLFNHLDRRCVVGSDFPEYSPFGLRGRVHQLSVSVPAEKLENVCWRNLWSFLGMDEPSGHFMYEGSPLK